MLEIKELNSSQLKFWMSVNNEARIIEFYASWCIYHLLTKRKLEVLSERLPEIDRVGRIDCLGNERLFESYGVNQIPTIGYFFGDTRLLWVGDTDLDQMLAAIEHANQREHVL